MSCAGCRRTVLVTWALDGTEARYCDGCIRRALREAEALWVADRMRRLFKRREP